MLKLKIPNTELYDSEKNEFVYIKEQNLSLEHSLVSISKWEQKWCEPFLSKKEKSQEQMKHYVECMTLTQNVNPRVYDYIVSDYSLMKEIQDYIEAPMTATWFGNNEKKKPNNRVITNELVYYWMTALQIPFECQKWHFNRLMTFIQVCNIENQPKKKMSKGELARRNKALNAARRKKHHTRG